MTSQGFEEEVALVQRWQRDRPDLEFEALCKHDEFVKRIIAANDGSSCIFAGPQCAARVYRRPELVCDEWIDTFVSQGREQYGVDPTQNTT